jgi:hypothetical protein
MLRASTKAPFVRTSRLVATPLGTVLGGPI